MSMSDLFTRDQVSRAVNDGADLVSEALSLGELETDLINLIVNAALSKLDNPDVDFDTMIEENFDGDPRTWWDWAQ
jgi:hypothetical protein